jgi:excisionase family DNA binding protein
MNRKEIPNAANKANAEEKIEAVDRLRSSANQCNESANTFFENRIDREWLTTIEAAHWLAITPNALRILVHRDQVRVYKFGRRLRFRMTDLQALFHRKGA